MKALVTGATGALGRQLAAKLIAQGWHVRALLREHSRIDPLSSEIEIVRGDLRDRTAAIDAVRDCDAVFHIGAHTRGSWDQWAAYRHCTVRGTQHMLEAALQHTISRFVHVSCLTVYQVIGHAWNALLDEHAPLEPLPDRIGPHCRAKIEAEELAWSFSRRGLPLCIIRAGLLYSAERPPLLNVPSARKRTGRAVLFGSGRNLMPLAHVANVADALILAAQCDAAVGEAFNIVDGHGLSQRECLRRLRRRADGPRCVLRLPLALALAAAGVREGLARIGLAEDRGTTPYGVASRHSSLRFSTSKATELLGWSPRVDLDEGLHSVVMHRLHSPELTMQVATS